MKSGYLLQWTNDIDGKTQQGVAYHKDQDGKFQKKDKVLITLDDGKKILKDAKRVKIIGYVD